MRGRHDEDLGKGPYWGLVGNKGICRDYVGIVGSKGICHVGNKQGLCWDSDYIEIFPYTLLKNQEEERFLVLLEVGLSEYRQSRHMSLCKM